MMIRKEIQMTCEAEDERDIEEFFHFIGDIALKDITHKGRVTLVSLVPDSNKNKKKV